MVRVLHLLVINLILIVFTFKSTVLFANSTPHFTGGHTQTFTVCQFSNPNPINTLLSINDLDIGQTETWSLISGAFHGIVSTSYATTSTGGIVTPIGMSYKPIGAFVGIDTFTFAVSDGIATDTTVVYVTVIAVPHVGPISGPVSVCTGANITLVDTPSGGTWSSVYTSASVTTGGVVTGLTAGIDTIKYTISNFCGAIQAQYKITINASPDYGIISGPGSVCIGAMISLFETSTTGAWSSSNTHATVSFGVVTGVTAGIDSILYTVTNTFCTSSAVLPITINPLPNAGLILGSSVLCISGTGILTDSMIGGVWTCSGTHASITTTGLVTGISAGMDTIIYTYTNPCGTATTSKIITINPYPTVDFIIGPSSICSEVPVLFTDSTVGGIWSSSNVLVAIVSGGLVTGLAAGIDTIKYSVNNDCGVTTAIHIITVNTFPVSGIIDGNRSICIGAVTTFTDTVSGGNWMISNVKAAGSNGIMTGVAVGLDTLVYKIANICGTDSTSAILTINPLPYAGEIIGLVSLCPTDTVFFYSTVGGGSWSSSNTLIALVNITIADSTLVIALAPGTDTIMYSVTNMCGTANALFPVDINYSSICPNLVKQINQVSKNVLVYPNPINGESKITFPCIINSGALIICNEMGQTILNLVIENANDILIGAGIEANGVYFYKIINYGSGQVFAGKMVKQL